MPEINVFPYQNTPRNVVVTARDYADGTMFALHSHPRGQFAYAASGVITVFTDEGNWVVPPQRAIWVPAHLPHAMQMRGPVTLHNTYIRKQAACRHGLPEKCQVFDVSVLLRQLLLKAIDAPARYDKQGRDGHLMELLLHEIAEMPALSLNAPLPSEPRLARVCREFLAQPSLEVSIDQMAERAGMSRRTFTRHFRLHTGISFIEWRQQACLLDAVVQLGKGQSVTHVAMALGYSSSSAFTTAFKQSMGQLPSRYFAG